MKKITKQMVAKAGGLQFEVEFPEVMNIPKSKEAKLWPEGKPMLDIVFVGQKVYARTARDLALELGTTPRQISKLRAGRITECKPIEWYNEDAGNRPKGI